MDRDIKKIIIEIPINSLYQRRITSIIGNSHCVEIEYSDVKRSVAQYLDIAILASIAGLVLGLIQLALETERRIKEKKSKSQYRIKEESERIHQKAIELVGNDEITEVKIDSLSSYYKRESSSYCLTAEIHDEYYTFVVKRQKEIMIIKQE